MICKCEREMLLLGVTGHLVFFVCPPCGLLALRNPVLHVVIVVPGEVWK